MSERLTPICPHCDGFVVLLMPDYASSGVWCNRCGWSLERAHLRLPESLWQDIEHWNTEWEQTVSNTDHVIPAWQDRGYELAKRISLYHVCNLRIHVPQPSSVSFRHS